MKKKGWRWRLGSFLCDVGQRVSNWGIALLRLEETRLNFQIKHLETKIQNVR